MNPAFHPAGAPGLGATIPLAELIENRPRAVSVQ